MTSSKKLAQRDATEYARAQMAHGEGAGVRRRLIHATVEQRAAEDPTYAAELRVALRNQDYVEHAEKARRERKRADRYATINRNFKGAIRGDVSAVNTSVLVVGFAAYVAHQRGWDTLAYDKTRELKTRASVWWRQRRNENVINITDAKPPR